MRFIKFNDETVDTFLFMQLSDLVKTLTKRTDIDIEFGVQSYYHPIEQKIYVSHFWNHRSDNDKMTGLKSDVYLRAIGSFYFTDFEQMAIFQKEIRNINHPEFARQMFMLCEDLRIEECIKRKRPGTKQYFQKRSEMLKKYFGDQLKVNVGRSNYADALLCAFYFILTASSPIIDIPSIDQTIDRRIPFLKMQAMKVFEAENTRDVSQIVLETAAVLDDVLPKDVINTYFVFPDVTWPDKENSFFDQMSRKHKLQNQDSLKNVKKGDEDLHDEKMATWHRETSTPTKSFLQFDLQQGTQTNLINEEARQAETGDQAFVIVEGSARKTNNKDYAKVEAAERTANATYGKSESFGKENRFAKAIDVFPKLPTVREKSIYEQNLLRIKPYTKKLRKIMEKTLEHKKQFPKSDYHFGRLHQKLIRLWIDENPRMFAKKRAPSPEIDAVFCLLVDCSASMYDKMDETKVGTILFHEALKTVRVPHQIVGFWEDSSNSREQYQPNYFQKVITFPASLQPGSGPEIMQLSPEEDNRDGFAIRHMTKELLARNEKQKFLLVFSDGEPAAFGYDQNGLVDTHEAVLEARKQGVEVMNIFLSNGHLEESQKKTIQMIYGKYSMFVQNSADLPDRLFPLLRKMLQKSII